MQDFKYPGTTGNNFLTIETRNGAFIKSVTIDSPSGFTTLDHTRFRAVEDEWIETPEPSALEGLLLGMGILGFAGMTSRKLKLGR